jgi:CBS domain-containing protein
LFNSKVNKRIFKQKKLKNIVKMNENIKVGDIMTRNFIHISPDTPLHQCTKTMIKKRVGSLVLKEKNKISGILTEKDLVWALYKKKGKDFNKIKAEDIATKKVVSIRPDASLEEAIKKMNKKKIRRLPVISNKQMIGYLTQKDILKFNPKLFETLNEISSIREEADKLKRQEISKQKIIKEINDYDEDEE